MIQDKIKNLQSFVYEYLETPARDHSTLTEIENRVNSLSAEILKMSDTLNSQDREQINKELTRVTSHFSQVKHAKEVDADTGPWESNKKIG